MLAHLCGDYIAQSDWQANEKNKSPAVALLHGASYAACFVPLTRSPKALAVIGGSHAVIDHWRLAKHVVWAKNQIAPAEYRYPFAEAGPHGYVADKPDWLAYWLLFLCDNTMHGLVNRWALKRWGR